MSRTVSGAISPNAPCVALVTLRFPGRDAARYESEAQLWEFKCPYCHEQFCVTEDQLIQREVSPDWVNQRFHGQDSWDQVSHFGQIEYGCVAPEPCLPANGEQSSHS